MRRSRCTRQELVRARSRSFALLGVKGPAFPNVHRPPILEIRERDAANAGHVLVFLSYVGASPWSRVLSDRTLDRAWSPENQHASYCPNDHQPWWFAGSGIAFAHEEASISIGLSKFTGLGAHKGFRDIQLHLKELS